jgi:endonuclease YncB( thermonuclease family)
MKRVPVQTPEMARKFLLGVVALTALAWPRYVVAQGVKTTVLSIGDSDTIRVRLACINSPESAQAPYGQQGPTHL